MPGTKDPSINAHGNVDDLRRKGGMNLAGNALNYGFIGLDSYMNMKDGKSAPVAIGQAVLTNAAFAMMPGGLLGGIGLMAVASAPEFMNQLDGARGRLSNKKQNFGGDFENTQSQMALMQQGLGNMQNARTHANRAMANHARGAQRVY